MPTYEYYCPACDKSFEYFQSITAEPLAACPECHKPVQRKISGGAGLIFKGSGFYITDYKKNGKDAIKTNKPETKETSNRDNSNSPKKDTSESADKPTSEVKKNSNGSSNKSSSD